MKKLFLSLFTFLFWLVLFPSFSYAQDTGGAWAQAIDRCVEGNFWYGKAINEGLKYISSINIQDAAEGKIGMNKEPLCELAYNKPWTFTALRQLSNIFWILSIFGIFLATLFMIWRVLKKKAQLVQNADSNGDGEITGIEVLSAIFFKANGKGIMMSVLLEVGISLVVTFFLILSIIAMSIFNGKAGGMI